MPPRFILFPLEAISVIIPSSLASLPDWKNTGWDIVSFQKDRLVDRMGTLTLIVMGEGVIVLLKTVKSVTIGAAWNGSIFGVIFSALLISVCRTRI
jgi:hypothetical protein